MNLSNDFLCRHYPFCGHNSSSHDNSSAVIKQRTKGINKKIFANWTSMSDPTTNK
ncbi:hypothetical protein GTW56_09285 [Bacillus sp. EB93]|uniref:Uncharacterized protein n=1 Tax=Peribacillus simplex TaxID=1478 RepID=A0AAN2PM65_9BACI|nr:MULTISPECIES: hypothetical protein [Peribacillus]MCP1155117.1 hypothetical protein [Peribacillus frigoritolerans]MCT1391914.1 hypothetical protein [Peribacillus frigoritolerans]NCT36571.1 hypothetical protein [Peribacillus frigoritolerans]CEG34786.1 hypothetical protein BN1180_04991 [Peribacillus simplex]